MLRINCLKSFTNRAMTCAGAFILSSTAAVWAVNPYTNTCDSGWIWDASMGQPPALYGLDSSYGGPIADYRGRIYMFVDSSHGGSSLVAWDDNSFGWHICASGSGLSVAAMTVRNNKLYI